jgi:5'(3')-deoxyribonucleotidase
MEEIKKRKNWKCAYTEIAKILNAYDVKELYVPIYKGIVSRDIVNETVVKYIEALDADSTYRKFCEETAAIMGNFHSNKDAQAIAYKELMQVFDVKHTATDISKDVKARYEALFDKYPMLKFLEGTGHGSNLSSRTAVDRLLGYIKLIDNNTRGNTNE